MERLTVAAVRRAVRVNPLHTNPYIISSEFDDATMLQLSAKGQGSVTGQPKTGSVNPGRLSILKLNIVEIILYQKGLMADH